jgi:hypothetical protein
VYLRASLGYIEQVLKMRVTAVARDKLVQGGYKKLWPTTTPIMRKSAWFRQSYFDLPGRRQVGHGTVPAGGGMQR